MKSLLALLALSLVTFARAHVTETISQTHPVNRDATLELTNVNGSIEIVAWDKNEVSIEAEKKSPSEEDLAQIHVTIEASPSSIKIDTKHERRFFHEAKGDVRYRLKVPASLELRNIHSVNSKIDIKGIEGPIHVSTVNGSIDMTGAKNGAHLRTVNGSIDARMAQVRDSDSIELETVNGSCKLRVPQSINAKLDASAVNGHVRCDFPITIERTHRNSIKGNIGSGAAHIKLRSVNGSLTVAERTTES